MDEPLDTIINMLRDEQGISPAKLRPSARLLHDLGLDGDDAHDFFLRLHERFGTDFTGLDWPEFFNSEGISLNFSIISLVSIISATAMTLSIAIAFKLPNWMFWEVNVAVLLIILFVLNRLFPRKPKRPLVPPKAQTTAYHRRLG